MPTFLNEVKVQKTNAVANISELIPVQVQITQIASGSGASKTAKVYFWLLATIEEIQAMKQEMTSLSQGEALYNALQRWSDNGFSYVPVSGKINDIRVYGISGFKNAINPTAAYVKFEADSAVSNIAEIKYYVAAPQIS